MSRARTGPLGYGHSRVLHCPRPFARRGDFPSSVEAYALRQAAAYITIGLVWWFLRNASPSTERLAVVRSLALGALLSLIPDTMKGGIRSAARGLDTGSSGAVSVAGFHYLRVLREGAVKSPELVDRFAWIRPHKAPRL